MPRNRGELQHDMRKTLACLLAYGTLVAAAQTPRLVLPVGHSGYITSVAFSPPTTDDPAGGKYILTGSTDNTAKLWDRNGHEITTFVGHQFTVYSVAFSPDGHAVLTASGDNTAKLWDLAGNLSKTLSDHKNYVRAVAFSPDGKYALTGSEDKTAKRWDLASGKAEQTYPHSQAVTSVAFARDGNSFLTGSRGGNVKLWNSTAPARPVRTIKAHSDYVTSVAFAPDEKSILTGSKDKTAKRWSLDGRLLHSYPHFTEVAVALFVPNGQQVVTGDLYGKVRYWSLAGERIKDYTAHKSEITTACFSPNVPTDTLGNNRLLTGSADGTARIWDLAGNAVATLKGHTDAITALAFAPDGKALLANSADGTIRKWRLNSGDLQQFPGHREENAVVAVSPDGDFFLTTDDNGVVHRRDLSGQTLQTYRTSSAVSAVAFSPDGKFVLAGSNRDSVYIWDLTGQTHRTFWVSTRINALAMSPSGLSVVTAGKNGATQCWDLSGNELLSVGRSDNVEVLAVAFSPDGQSILTGTYNGIAKLWDRATGAQKMVFDRRTFGGASAVTFAPDGQSAVVGHKNGTTKIWDIASGKPRATLIELDSTDWVVTTPDGLFDASPSAMQLMYYVQGLEVIELGQLKDRYYEPGLLARVVGLAEGDLRQVSGLGNRALPLFPLLQEATVEGDKIRIRLEERSGGIGAVVVLLDGRIEMIPDANPKRLREFEIDLSAYADWLYPDQPNALSLVLYDKENLLPSAPHPITYPPEGTRSKGGPDTAPVSSILDRRNEALANTLYALVIGTSDYAGTALDLRFPDQDASKFKEALETYGAPLFADRMHLKLLTTAKNGAPPTKAAIQAALAEFAAKAEPKDILLVFLSGHGTTWPENSPAGKFYYLTANNSSFDLADADNFRHAIAQDSLQAWIRQIKARKRTLILDACNSGEVVKSLDIGAKGNLNSDQRRALERMSDRSGFFVLASSSADKKSYEDPRFGHGLLTYSLLNKMPEVAARDQYNYVDVGKLFQEVREDVPKLAAALDKQQEPKLIGMEDFTIGIIQEGTTVRLPSEKKIVTRSAFFNEGWLDPLKIADAVNKELEQLLAAPDGDFAFWPAEKAAGVHYFLRGSYKVTDEVNITALFYKSAEEKTLLKTFAISHPPDQVKRAVDDLVGQLAAFLEELE